MAVKKTSNEGLVVINKIKTEKVSVRIKGLTDVITHDWSYKAKWEMLVRQMFGPKNKLLNKRLPKLPELDYAEGLYWISEKPSILNYRLPLDLNEDTSEYVTLVNQLRDNRDLILDAIDQGVFGFPAGGMKAAVVGACRLTDNLEMVTTKRLFHVDGFYNGKINNEYIVFENEDGTPCKPYIKEDMVVIGSGTADIRYRPAFKNWYATVILSYNAERFDKNTITNLLDASGSGGIGEWRPASKKTCSGNFGRYEVVSEPSKIK